MFLNRLLQPGYTRCHQLNDGLLLLRGNWPTHEHPVRGLHSVASHLSHESGGLAAQQCASSAEVNPHFAELLTWPTYKWEIPERVRPMFERVLKFIETEIYPLEARVKSSEFEDVKSRDTLVALQQKAKQQGLWALGHPKELGGGGMPFMDYVYINEAIGRSGLAMPALGTHSLQIKRKYLPGLFSSEIFPSFALTEPGVASSDPTGIKTEARLDERTGEWVINGHKWFTTMGSIAAYTSVVCRTEFDDSVPLHRSFSVIIVPTDTPGYNIQRHTTLLGLTGGFEADVKYENVRVPFSNLLGKRGAGFQMSQDRLGPGRIFHCMRWLGQAERAFDLMCNRMLVREVRGRPLAARQLMQKFVFDSYAEIQSCRMLTLSAAQALDKGGDVGRIDIGLIKVVGATMLHNVIDRAIQVFGAAGLTEDTPLSGMYRAARAARIYDGPDEVHVQNVSLLILAKYAKQRGMKL